MAPMRARAAAALVALALLAACTGGDAGDGPAPAPTTTTAAPTTTTSTTLAPLERGAGSPAAAACPTVPPLAAPAPDRPRYDLRIDVRPDEGVVDGDLTVRFTPDLPTDRLVFRLWPNGPRLAGRGAGLEPGPVALADRPAPAVERPDPTTLVVALDPALVAGEAVVASLPWRLRLPDDDGDRVAVAAGAVRLGSFFPLLSWEPGVGWSSEPPTTGFAEATTSPAADVEATITAPPGMTVLATGEEVAPGRWRAAAVRDLGVSVGRFTLAEGTAAAPAAVRVVVGVDAAVVEDPAPYLAKVVAALERFAARFGPYPWPTFTLAITAGLGGGIEYPGHVMQGPATIGRVTSHEVAHQWFYAVTGNAQGRDPWLDEGLATWAEATFEGALPAVVGRPMPAVAAGRAGEPMAYWDAHPAAYYAGVYVQGAQAVAALGPPEAVDCALAHLVAAEAFGIATPADLLAAARLVHPDPEAVLAPFGVVPAPAG
jgi:hypothetical protein